MLVTFGVPIIFKFLTVLAILQRGLPECSNHFCVGYCTIDRASICFHPHLKLH